MSPRAILFDLFGTVVEFSPQVPTLQVAGTQWRSTMGWLQPVAETMLPQVGFAELLQALLATTEEIVRDRPPEYREISSPIRFARALRRLGVEESRLDQIAGELSLVHMRHIASLTFLPAGHRELLQQVAGAYRIGLVSNFDHAPTAHRILADAGVASLFEVTLISDDFGRRKPHRAIFRQALDRLGVEAAETWFIGDSLDDDIAGAAGIGMPSVWLDKKGKGAPQGGPVPDRVIARLLDLPELLARH